MNNLLMIIFLCLNIEIDAQIQLDSLSQPATEQPAKIAFVFSGGGVKGIAQVGALKVLEDAGIRPDYITGTSIGSILGGLYAIGYTASDLEKLALELDWESYFSDELERTYLPIEEREFSNRFMIRFPIEDWKIKLPTGFVEGQKISLLLSRLTIPAHSLSHFDDFTIPFRAVAADVETGDAYVFERGDLADALRASMSIPSVFNPFLYDEKLLIDGGVARNLPVQDAIDMGADFIIAIDIGGALYAKDEVQSLFTILEQTGSYRVVEESEKQSKLADFIIKPNISGISALSFEHNDTLLYRGRKAGQDSIETLFQLLPIQIDTNVKKSPVKIPTEYFINKINIQIEDLKIQKNISNILQFKPNKVYSIADIENKFLRLFGSDLVKNANYRLIPYQNGYELVVNAIPQRGEFFQLSANYDSKYKAGLLFNPVLRNRIFNSSRLSIDFKLSENPFGQIDYRVYTASRPNIGWQFGAKAQFFPGELFEDGDKVDIFRLRHFDTQLNLISGLNQKFFGALGIGIDRFVLNEELIDQEDDNFRLSQVYGNIKLIRDTYDRIDFPKDGSRLLFEARFNFGRKLKQIAFDSLAQINNINARIRLQIDKIFPINERFATKIFLDGGYIPKFENNYLNRFYLGRELPNEVSHTPFYGLRYMETVATAYGIAGAKFRVEPAKDFFASVVMNYAYAELSRSSFEGNQHQANSNTAHIFGVAMELGLVTILGPARFSMEYNFEYSRVNFLLHLGYAF